MQSCDQSLNELIFLKKVVKENVVTTLLVFEISYSLSPTGQHLKYSGSIIKYHCEIFKGHALIGTASVPLKGM